MNIGEGGGWDQKHTQDKEDITKMNPGLTWLMDFA